MQKEMALRFVAEMGPTAGRTCFFTSLKLDNDPSKTVIGQKTLYYLDWFLPGVERNQCCDRQRML